MTTRIVPTGPLVPKAPALEPPRHKSSMKEHQPSAIVVSAIKAVGEAWAISGKRDKGFLFSKLQQCFEGWDSPKSASKKKSKEPGSNPPLSGKNKGPEGHKKSWKEQFPDLFQAQEKISKEIKTQVTLEGGRLSDDHQLLKELKEANAAIKAAKMQTKTKLKTTTSATSSDPRKVPLKASAKIMPKDPAPQVSAIALRAKQRRECSPSTSTKSQKRETSP